MKWKAFSKLWRYYRKNNTDNEMQECNLNGVFKNRSKEKEIFPLATPEIAEVQKANNTLKHCFKCNAVLDKRLDLRLFDDTYMVCKDGRMIISKLLQRHAVLWFHHYLQHLGHTQLEETMKATMYLKGMRTSIWSTTKLCRACQVNKKLTLKYGHLLPKTVMIAPWRALCVDLIGLNTLKDIDGTVIDFMALTMINPATNQKLLQLMGKSHLLLKKSLIQLLIA